MSDPMRADGTSQAARRWPELDPASAPVDERSTLDLLAFAQALGRELKYIAAPGGRHGDWRALLPDPARLDEAIDALVDPQRLPPDRAADWARPHVALLLAFIDLLGVAREQLNGFGRRHLDFWYRDVLRMTAVPALPDRVHVIVEPDARTPAVELPAGSALRAGKDSSGVERLYRTETTLVARPVTVAALKTVRADIRRTGLREASLRYLVSGTRADAFVGMLRIALGQPDPGGLLPSPICADIAAAAGGSIGFDQLVAAHERLRRVAIEIGMPNFDDYRRLVALRAQRRQRDAPQWARINATLTAAGKKRSGNPAFALVITRADDFVANLRQALDLTADGYAHYYDGLPEVKSAEQANAVLDDRPDVQAFVRTKLFLDLPAFRSMMAQKAEIDADWAEIAALAEGALRVKSGNPDALLAADQRALRDVDALLDAAAGFRPPEGLDAFHAAFLAIERWFCLSAERIDYLMSAGRRAATADLDAATWERVYALGAAAHEALIYRLRRDALVAAAQPGIAAGDARAALAAMLQIVLGEALPLNDALAALAPLKLNAADAKVLADGAKPGVAASAVDWARAAAVLEVAQRNREQFVPPAAEQLLWRHLYAAADARSVQPAAVPAGQTRWKTFGSADAGKAAATPPPPLIGFAIASPLLALAEGTRTITLKVGLLAQGFDAKALQALLAPGAPGPATRASVNPFVVQCSGAKGWVDAACDISWTGQAMDGYPVIGGVDTKSLKMLQLTLRLDDRQPPIVPPTLALHGWSAAAPVLRLLLAPAWSATEGAWATAYPVLRNLQVSRAWLGVTVNGLSSLLLRNDQSALDPKKPFEPFGSQPAAGARLLIGHSELVGKPLDALTFRFRWMGAPASFTTQYTNYPGSLSNASFTARVGLQDGALFAPATASMSFFDAGDTSAAISRAITLPADPGSPASAASAGSELGAWNRVLVWELAGDFQHSVYPSLALQNSMAMAGAVARGEKPADGKYLINPPYTPKLKSLVVDYASSAEGALADAATFVALHQHPFGRAPAAAEVDPAIGSPLAVPLLPRYDDEGELYIGIANTRPPQTLALLLQMAEGSADPDAVPAPVQWSCLDADRWVSLHDGALLEDGTRGLINSGLVRFALPAVRPSTRMPAGAYWLRATIARASAGVCDAVAVHPNAVVAVFADQGNAPDHLDAALAPGSVDSPVVPTPGLGRLKQPYSSFGGKAAEREADFDLRVSERLRHRARALTAWDYERLVLERFPLLHKVKCLRAGPDDAPGLVDLVVIPDIVGRFPFNPFEPKASADLLRDIETFLADKLPAWATLRVRNARFVPLRVRCGVRFVPGIDEGLARAQLDDELNRFLSPWAYGEGADLAIGGAIYANSIIDFIDSRDYVDYLAELRLFLGRDGRDVLVPPGPDYAAQAASDDEVLVGARTHVFDVITHADYRIDGFGGINYMKIELDFIVS